MKIKISKVQWENIGKKAGWMKVAGSIENADAYKKGYSTGKKSLNSRHIDKSDNPYKKGTNEWSYWDEGYYDAINSQPEKF